MTRGKKRFWSLNYYTMLKYFLSYFFMLSFLLLCFFLAFRHQLRTVYATEADKSIHERLTLFQENFNDTLDRVFNIHYSLCNNDNLKMLRYSDDTTWYSSLCVRDMREFAATNALLKDIVYIDRYRGNILACDYYVYRAGDEYYLMKNGRSLKIPVGQYGHNGRNTMVYAANQAMETLLLFPNVESGRYELFYVIDSQEIVQSLESMLSEEIAGVLLTDGENHVIASLGDTQGRRPPSQYDLLEIGRLEESDEVIYTVPLYADLRLTVYFSRDLLLGYANRAFLQVYSIVAAIGAAGLLLLVLGMRLTYLPLRRLGNKFVGPSQEGTLEQQLERTFASSLEEQRRLQQKIDKYHELMRASVLDTIVNENGEEITAEKMDELFNGEPGSLIFVAKIAARSEREQPKTREEFGEYFARVLPGEASFCVRLEATQEYGAWLIYYGGQEQDKYNVMCSLLRDYQHDSGRRVAMSDGSSSPLDIPGLYVNAVKASARWERESAVFYEEADEAAGTAEQWPQEELRAFAGQLQQLAFEPARETVRKLFHLLDTSGFPEFYSRSVLTEMVTCVITAMNQQNIKFGAYSAVYFETLYYIRSFSYREKSGPIYDHFLSLLALFEQEMGNLTIKSGELAQFVREHYESAELSIAMLAKRFHVSIAYMSYLFKKYFGENFSDYLWKLRVERAKELLRETSQPVEEICLAVGYENVSSFRRKFKKELGITPSQYRGGEDGEGDL